MTTLADSAVAVGQQAPGFTLRTTGGRTISLADYAGKRHVLLAFYPMDWSSVCSLQLPNLQERLADIEQRQAVVLGISVDQIHSHTAFAKHLGIKFDLLADFHPKGDVARSYGVYRENDGFSERATFIVDKAGTVRFKQVHPMKDLPDVDELLRVLDGIEG